MERTRLSDVPTPPKVASEVKGEPPVPAPPAIAALPNTLFVCVVDKGGVRKQTAIEFAPKVDALCAKHPEMGPCQYERNICRSAGGRVYAANGDEITMTTEADDDKKVMLEGWAIVDNTSGEDRKDVLVGVASSSTLSFRYDRWSVRQLHRQPLPNEAQFALTTPNGVSQNTNTKSVDANAAVLHRHQSQWGIVA